MRRLAIKPLVVIALLVFAAVGCAQQNAVQQNNWRQQGFDSQSETIGRMVKEKRLSISEANKQMVFVARNYFPNDRLLIELWQDLAELADRMDRAELSFEQYDQLRGMRFSIFDDANRNRHAEAEAIEADKRRALFMSRALGNIGQSIQRNYPQPITCRSTSMPGVVTTNCQ